MSEPAKTIPTARMLFMLAGGMMMIAGAILLWRKGATGAVFLAVGASFIAIGAAQGAKKDDDDAGR